MLWCRQYWSITGQGKLSVLYIFVFTCLAPFIKAWKAFSTQRDKSRMLAKLPWTYGSAVQYLQNTYSKDIQFIEESLSNYIYLSSATENEPVWIASDPTNVQWLPSIAGKEISIRILLIYVPQSFVSQTELYNSFIADITMLIPKGINYKIITQ